MARTRSHARSAAFVRGHNAPGPWNESRYRAYKRRVSFSELFRVKQSLLNKIGSVRGSRRVPGRLFPKEARARHKGAIYVLRSKKPYDTIRVKAGRNLVKRFEARKKSIASPLADGTDFIRDEFGHFRGRTKAHRVAMIIPKIA